MGNGFDINNFGSMISNLGKASANMQNDAEKALFAASEEAVAKTTAILKEINVL